MTFLLRFCLSLLLLVPLSGCVTHWHGKEMRSDILALRGQMDQLVDDHRKQKQELQGIVNKLENRLQALNKNLESSLGALRTNSANSGSNLDEMRQTVQDLRGQLAELKYKLAQQDRDLTSMSPPTSEPLPKDRKALFNFASKRFEAGD